MIPANKRDRLVESAALLFHRKGLSATSLADIAKQADIPIGNVYYYFKTKEDLAMAALAQRREQFSAAYFRLDEDVADPRQRLIEAVDYFNALRDEYARFGCPIGKIIGDASPENEGVVAAAAQVLEDFVSWAEHQFKSLGHGSDARKYATSLMSGIQGATIMAKSARNPDVISEEVSRLTQWLEALPNRKIQIGKVAIKPPGAVHAA